MQPSMTGDPCAVQFSQGPAQWGYSSCVGLCREFILSPRESVPMYGGVDGPLEAVPALL